TTRCYIEPSERYFVNMRPDPEYCLNQHETCGGTTTTMAILTRGTVPYAGPCLDNGPYPLNYDNATCGERQSVRRSEPDWHGNPIPAGQQNCRERHATTGTGLTFSTVCYDPYDVLPSKTYTSSCSPDGEHWVWTEGYRESASSHYLCEQGGVSYEFDKIT